MRFDDAFALALALLAGVSGAAFAAGGGAGGHKGLRATLPFDDERDFEEAKTGFIAAPPYKRIMAEAGNVAWDMGSYEFLLQGTDFDRIDPSLQRQAILNMSVGTPPVVAVVYSHSRVDHYGGARGVVDEADVKSGKLPVTPAQSPFEQALPGRTDGG